MGYSTSKFNREHLAMIKKSSKTFYIQRKDGNNLETVDEFETRKEAREMLKEYQISDRTAHFYISTRACKGWKD